MCPSDSHSESQLKTNGFLKPYERDVMLMECHEALTRIMQHFGIDASAMGFDLESAWGDDSIPKRKTDQEYEGGL